MPLSRICAESVLLTPQGWRIAKHLRRECAIVGVDRHGKVVTTDAELITGGETTPLAYVGTAAACGAFARDTRLIANDGKRWSINELVESGGVSSVHFETLVRLPETVNPKLAAKDLWPTLLDAAAVGNDRCVTLRCRDPIRALGTKRQFPQAIQIADQAFAVLDRHEFDTALGANWSDAITNLVGCWLLNGDDDRVEVERSAYYLAVWFASARTESQLGYAFQYDTMQHSSYVFVTIADEQPRPLQRSACAFYTPHHSHTATLSWRDSSVAPVAAGFLLTGS